MGIRDPVRADGVRARVPKEVAREWACASTSGVTGTMHRHLEAL